MERSDNIIPKQQQGGSSDTSAKIELDLNSEAVNHFHTVCSRLLNVSRWHETGGPDSAKFQLTDTRGELLFRPAEKDDLIRISIPAPGTETGEGYDWVQIDQIEHQNTENETEYLAIRVRPVPSPLNSDESTAHFFKEDATSTFIVKRKLNVITAEVHGRNEEPNISDAEGLDKLRNAVVGIGAMLGMSKVQWKKLAEGLVQKSD